MTRKTRIFTDQKETDQASDRSAQIRVIRVIRVPLPFGACDIDVLRIALITSNSRPLVRWLDFRQF